MTLPDHDDDDPRATVPIVLGSNFAQFAIGHPVPAQPPPPPDPAPRRLLWIGVALLAVAVAAAFAALAYHLLT